MTNNQTTKHDPTEAVDGSLYTEAIMNWSKFWHKHGQNRSISDFLGMTRAPLLSPSNKPLKLFMRSSAARKIKKLAGPNSYAILTLYKIRKGW